MTTRRLAGILAADVVGFSALMGQIRGRHSRSHQSLRREMIDPKVTSVSPPCEQSIETVHDGVPNSHGAIVALVGRFLNRSLSGIRAAPRLSSTG
jgi:hypothetical protein